MKIKDPPMSKENFKEARKILMGTLSKLEKSVLRAYLRMDTYKKMAKEANCSERCIANALMRIRRKAGNLLKNGKLDHIPEFRNYNTDDRAIMKSTSYEVIWVENGTLKFKAFSFYDAQSQFGIHQEVWDFRNGLKNAGFPYVILQGKDVSGGVDLLAAYGNGALPVFELPKVQNVLDVGHNEFE